MAVKDLSTTDLTALENTRDAATGLLYPAHHAANWHRLINAMQYHLSRAANTALKVKRDDANDTTIRIMPGRARIGEARLTYAGGTIDLAAMNNDTVYVWAYNSTGTLTIDKAIDGTGWPAYEHIKLAEVVVSAGDIDEDAIVDHRPAYQLHVGIEAELADVLVTYTMAITTQGDTGTPSVVTITAKDANGNALTGTQYLRVRVCNSGGYSNATNATIAAGTNTTAVETHTTNKDITFHSHTDGTWRISLTDASAETVTLRIGPAPLSMKRADTTPTQNVTHAAP